VDRLAVKSNLFRCQIDYRKAHGGLTSGKQLVGGLDEHRQAGSRLADGAGV
jgi:hypothetical protein